MKIAKGSDSSLSAIGEAKGNELLILLFFFLLLDGFTSQWQSRMFQRHCTLSIIKLIFAMSAFLTIPSLITLHSEWEVRVTCQCLLWQLWTSKFVCLKQRQTAANINMSPKNVIQVSWTLELCCRSILLAICYRPSRASRGYLFGGICWFAISFSLATSLNLSSTAL